MAVIACVDLDPLLVGLVERVRPSDSVVAVPADELLSTSRRYAAVVMASTSPLATQVRSVPLGTRTVLVVEPGERSSVADHPGAVVRRPVEPGELGLALARLAPAGRLARVRRRAGELGTATSVDAVLAASRLAAVAAAAGLEVAGLPKPPAWLILLAIGWATLRLWLRATSPALVAADVALAATAIVVTGGTDSSFLLLAAVAATETGYALPAPVSLTVVGAATIAGLVPLSLQIGRGAADVPSVLAWGTLIPMASAIGLLADRMRRSRSTGSLELLTELHRTLDRLARQAQGFEGTLELSSLAEQVLTSLERDLETRAALLLVGDGSIKDVAAARGLRDVAPTRVVLANSHGDLPVALRDLLPPGEVLQRVVRTQGVERGLIVAVVPGGTGTRHTHRVLQELADIAGVAIDNARLFQGIRELTVDVERRRLARELHDGVIQSLVHVGFELDLLGRTVDDGVADEVARLREVVGRTVDEVRATVNGLRSVRLSSGLGAALLSLARDYRREGLDVVADVDPVEGLPPEAELQLLRIAQEAVSNAVNHGDPTAVRIELSHVPDALHLSVVDDGVGIRTGAPDTHGDVVRGVGLRAMQERVDLLGGQLALGEGPHGGTCVKVSLPLERSRS